MKQQKHDFRKMSETVCSQLQCRTMIKLNVVERKQTDLPLLCYPCSQKKKRKGHNK